MATLKAAPILESAFSIKKNGDPVQFCYHEMLKFSDEVNWANDVVGLRKKYNLPLHDDNVKNMGVKDWKWIVESTIYREAFWELKAECYSNEKTSRITHKHFGTSDYLLNCHLNLHDSFLILKLECLI